MDEFLTGKPGALMQMQKPGVSEPRKSDAPMPAFDLPASSTELRSVREELLREFRKIGAQVQTACTEEIRGQSQNLLKELKQELQSQRSVRSWQAADILQSPPLFRPGSGGNVARKSKARISRMNMGGPAPNFAQLSAHWMPEAVEKASKGQIMDGVDSGGEDVPGQKSKGEKSSAAARKSGGPGEGVHARQAWSKIAGETDHDLWSLPVADAQVEPPQLPHEVPLPPPDPPQVECNGDAAAGQPGGASMQGARSTADDHGGSVVSFKDIEDGSDDEEGWKSDISSSLESERVRRSNLLQKQSTRRLSLGLTAARRSRLLKEKAKPPLCSMSAKDILKSSRFDNLMGMVILLNAVTIGVQADYASRHLTDNFPVVYSWLERVFCLIFLIELSLRLFVHGMSFFTRRDYTVLWNYFDFFVVAAQVTEESLMWAASSSGLDLSSFRLLRVLRVLRLVRIFRVIRVLHLISELRTIISSIMGSFRSLGWTVVLLFLMIYIVGVYFTQSITDHMVEKYADGSMMTQQDKDLRYYFGDLFRAILSLWQAMSGGADWDAMAGPLVSIDVTMGIAFAAYIAFALLALMNVVTGVFVQTALQNAKDEEDAFLTDQIIKLFERCDNSRRHTITLEEINQRLNDPESQGEWKAINVSPEEAHYLFELLDIDQTGEIQFEEFLSGCLRLHGTSKSMDLLTVMQECRTEFRLWHTHLSNWERFQDMHKQITMALTSQVTMNNHILQQFLESYEGSLQTAIMHKESVQRFEAKLKPMEKSFEVVKRMLRAPGGMETIIEVMTSNSGSNSEGRTEENPWPLRSKFDEV